MYKFGLPSAAALGRLKLTLTRQSILVTALHASISAVFFLVPWWLRPDWTPKAPAPYFLGFLITVPVLLAIALWLLLGAPGLGRAVTDRRYLWITPLVLLTGWGFLSIQWTKIDYRSVAVAWSLQFG